MHEIKYHQNFHQCAGNDAHNQNIVNLANGVDPQDAATVGQTQAYTDNAVAAIGGMYLIASKTNVDGTVAAISALTFATGKSNANSLPIFHVFKYRSGAFLACVANIQNSAGGISPSVALALLTTTDEITTMNKIASAPFPDSGNISVNVTTPNVAAANFDVFVYGIARP